MTNNKKAYWRLSSYCPELARKGQSNKIRKTIKKTIKSVSMLLPKLGGGGGWCSHNLALFALLDWP